MWKGGTNTLGKDYCKKKWRKKDEKMNVEGELLRKRGR